MLKKTSLINRLKAIFAGRKREAGYNQNGFQSSTPARQEGGYTQQKKVAKIKHWLVARKASGTGEYRPPQKKGKGAPRLLTAAFLSLLLLLFIMTGGDQKIQAALSQITMFQLSELEIRGNGIVSDERLREQAGLIVHQTSLFSASEEEIQRRLLTIPWLAEVEAKKRWPSTIVIEVKENIPMALLHDDTSEGGGLSYIDSSGVSFLPVKPSSGLDYPVITGLFSIADEELRHKSLEKVLIFLKKVRKNDPHLPAQSLSEVHLTKEGELVVYLVDYPFPIFFGNGNTKRNYGRLIQVLKALYKKENKEQLISRVAYIQMDYQQNKVLVARLDKEQ